MIRCSDLNILTGKGVIKMTMRRLARSKKQRVIGGVAGGLAEYFEVDVVLVRLLWVLAAFVGGGGVLAYIIAWIIIPEERTLPAPAKPATPSREGAGEETAQQASSLSEEASEEKPPDAGDLDGEEGRAQAEIPQADQGRIEEEHRARRRRNAGLLLIGLGLIFLARQVLPAFFFHYSWPLLLILLGLFFLMRDRREKK